MKENDADDMPVPPEKPIPEDHAEQARDYRRLLLRFLPGIALAAVVLLFTGMASLPVAVALVAVVAWHEVGQARTARRLGFPVRGLLGGLFAGGEEGLRLLSASRRDQIEMALGGPLYGVHVTLLAFVVALLFDTGGLAREVLFAAALLNLLNLLPVHPFDGGRIVHAAVQSLHPFAGPVLSGIGAAVLSALALASASMLVLFVAVVAIFEFLGEYRLYQRFKAVTAVQRAAGDNGVLPQDKMLLRLFTGGALNRRAALTYLAIYVALGLLYASALAVASYAPNLEAWSHWGWL